MLIKAEEDAQAPPPSLDDGWSPLGTPPCELDLDCTLPTGQSFRWRCLDAGGSSGGDYLGVIGQRAVHLRQAGGDVWFRVMSRGAAAPPGGDGDALKEYFNLGGAHPPLEQMAAGWAAADPHFAKVHPYFLGARMLRQDPVECLFSFICSSNNHISRIHGMVERLCSTYGTPLPPTTLKDRGTPEQAPEQAPGEAPKQGQQVLYAFPTLEQLAAASEEELRASGFGYRAAFVVGSAAALAAAPGGGDAWLAALRTASFSEAVEALCTLPGVGPKVAACVALFALDKHDAIPVDTHVWQLAVRHYTPHLRGAKSLTKKVQAEVQEAFVARFGPYAGWAHNTLFISELVSHKSRLPSQPETSRKRAGAGAEAEDDATADAGGSGAEAVAAEKQPRTPPLAEGEGQQPKSRWRRRRTAAQD